MNYYAPSVRLMNDGLNSSGNMIDATTAVNGLAGNIRYYGVDDSNLKNYIYFNCSDYSNQTSDTCETWRIIGIVDGKIKIIRNNKIEDLAWDYDKNTDLALESSSNNWENSSLQILLNQSYYNGDTSGEITYYSKKNGWPSDEEVETVLDMNNIGIKNSETRNLISNSIWYLGGYNQIHSIYANDIYTYERTDSEGTTLYSGNPFSLERNIGIMYASDYSYA